MSAPLVNHGPRDLNIHTLIGPDGCTVTVVGDVDGAAAPRLRECLLALLDRPEATDVELDLTGVTFLGSAGLTTLVIAHQRAERTGRVFKVRCDTSRAVLRPLVITGLSTVLTIVNP